MGSRTGWSRLVAAAIVVSAVTVAITTTPISAQTPKAGGSFTYLKAGTTPANWDPVTTGNQGNDATTGTAAYLTAVYGLLAIEDYRTGRILPSIATSITATDATHWTLVLRPNVKFTDGTTLDAAAVKFNWERHADRKNKSPNLVTATTIQSLTVVNAQTLAIVLKSPNTQFDRTVARNLSYIGSPKAIKADVAKFRTSPVGAGPFVLKSYTANQVAVYSRNRTYWDNPRPYLNELTIRAIADNQQRYNTMAAGGADLVQIFSGLTNVARAKQDGFRVIINQPGGGGQGFAVNHTRPPFDDPEARAAARAMFNTGGETNTVDGGVIKPLRNIFQPGSPYYDAAIVVPPYNARQAQLLLDDYERQHGKPLTFTIAVADVTRATAEYYQAQASEFNNVKVKIDVIAANAYVPVLARGAFDLGSYPFTFGDPIGETKLMLGTGGSKNWGKYSNPQVDKVLAAADASLVPAQRVKLYKQAEKLFLDDNAFLFTKQRPEVQAVRKAVQGLDYAIEGIPLWDRIWLS